MSATSKYLHRFFEEKDLASRTYEVEDVSETTHWIPSEVVIEVILHQAPPDEQRKIADVLRKIDFANGDVHDFLKHLAKGLANRAQA